MIEDSLGYTTMKLRGYIANCDHGFALPVYKSADQFANAWYVAIPQVEGDHRSFIRDFEVIDEVSPRELTDEREVNVGDPWIDVFLWGEEPSIGTPQEILKSLKPVEKKLASHIPLSYADLLIFAGGPKSRTGARDCLTYLIAEWGGREGNTLFQDFILRPGILLALNRVLVREKKGDRLPSVIREFDIRIETDGRYIIDLAKVTKTFFSNEHFSLLRKEISEFGRSVGCQLMVQLSDGVRSPPAAGSSVVDFRAPPSSTRVKVRGREFKSTRPSFRTFVRELAIDLGTSNTIIFARDRGLVLKEPSVVAVRSVSGTKRLLAFGNDALSMVNRTSDSVEVIRPLRDGAIADLELTTEMLKFFIRKIGSQAKWLRPLELLICIPAGSSSTERRAILSAARGAGASKVRLILAPIAAAIGADAPVMEAMGSMIVMIGGGTTEIAAISLGGLAHSVSIRVGGDKIDECIVSYVRRWHNLLIGESTAERIKKTYACLDLSSDSTGTTFYIKGRDLANGVPREIEMTQRDLSGPIFEAVGSIIEGIRIALENMPPELAADIVDQGIILTGGGALLTGIAEHIKEETGLPVDIADDPLSSIAMGVGRAMEDPTYRSVLFDN